MPPASAKRIAALAVLRFGVDRVRLREEVQAVLRERGQGIDLLAALVGKGLLTDNQADELRLTLKTRPHSVHSTAMPTPHGRVDLHGPDASPVPRSLGGYRILRWLGEGGMGAVYLGYDVEQRRPVAVKILAEELSSNPVCVECFYRESKSGTQLNHPCIVQGITAGNDEASGLHYLVREFVDGPSGHVLLDRIGRLSVGDAVRIALDMARALHYLHEQHLVHRDIKPDNILLDRSGTAKLTDLGLVKRIGEVSANTAVHHGFGTSYYMPYEQALDSRRVDGRSDIYALGATLYHLLTGQVPFTGENHLEIIQKKDLGLYVPASALNPDVPAELDGIIARMLARRPVDRYQTAATLAADLERSGLAAAVPTFSGLDWSREEQIVGSSRIGSNQPTSVDGRRAKAKTQTGRGKSSIWYLRYQDRQGRWCKTKATTKQLMRRLSTGRMPASVQASQEPRGQFKPLTTFPVFREAPALARLLQRTEAVSPRSSLSQTPLPPPLLRQTRSVRWHTWLRIGLAIASLAALGVGLYVIIT